MSQEKSSFRMEAERHFESARQEARRERFLSWLTGREERTLLPFEEIRAELREEDARCVGLEEIFVERIVGSVGRYADFTREFLPLKDELRERWVNLEAGAWQTAWSPREKWSLPGRGSPASTRS